MGGTSCVLFMILCSVLGGVCGTQEMLYLFIIYERMDELMSRSRMYYSRSYRLFISIFNTGRSDE